MKPGATTRSEASITVVAPSATRPISAILPPVMARSARRAGAPVPSTSIPFLIKRSWATSLSSSDRVGKELAFSHHRVAKRTNARNLDLHYVAVLHVLGGAVRAHPEHVARVEGEVLAHSRDERANAEDGVLDGVGEHLFPVEPNGDS